MSYSSRVATKAQGVSDRSPSPAMQGGTTPVTAQRDALGSVTFGRHAQRDRGRLPAAKLARTIATLIPDAGHLRAP